MKSVRVAATQMRCSENRDRNIAKAETLVREATSKGAHINLLQELFESLYFCHAENPDFLQFSSTVEKKYCRAPFFGGHQGAVRCSSDQFLREKEPGLLPYGSGHRCRWGRDGRLPENHIPDGPGYEEKYYFNPGDTGFCVWQTRYADIGIGICWDQWFPETARCLVLGGADILFYPMAIGSEPGNPGYDSRDHWRTCMQGHSGANMVPVVASNRTGAETVGDSTVPFTHKASDCCGSGEYFADCP